MGINGLLTLARNAVTPLAESRAASLGAQAQANKEKIAMALQQAQLERQQQQASIDAALKGAQMKHLSAQTDALEHPAPKAGEYDILDTDQGYVRVPKLGDAGAILGPGGLPLKKAATPVRQDHVTDPVTGEIKFFDPTKPPANLRVNPAPRSQQTADNQKANRALTLQQHFNNDQTFKDAQQVATAYQKISAAATGEHTATSDMSLVYGLMKMQDPGSTVREGEYASAENAKGVPDQIRNLYNKVKDGAILSERQRQQFLQTAGSIAHAQRGVFRGTLKRYGDMASRQGLDVADVVFDPYDGMLEDAPAVPQGAADPNGGRGGRGAAPPPMLSSRSAPSGKKVPSYEEWKKQQGVP